MEEQKINTIVNLGQSKVVEKLYDDLVSPISQKVGQALSTIVDVGNTILLPIAFLNAKAKLLFTNNIKKYEERLNKIPEDKIIEVPSEISIPILNRFTYISNEELSNSFVKLLETASNTETIALAHPGFVSIIDRLSPDEAKLLCHLKNKTYIPIAYVKSTKKKNSVEYRAYIIRTGLEKEVQLNFPDNIQVYLDNLQALGIIDRKDHYKPEEEVYQKLFSYYDDINLVKKVLSEEFNEPNWEREQYDITDYGKLFIKAVID